jgi:Ca2+-transporting ATPase
MLLLIAILDFAFLPILPKNDIAAHIIQGVVLLIIVSVNIALGTIQEVKANKALDALQKSSSPKAKVIRDGKQVIISSSELVVGDIILLEEGAIVPGDIRLFQVNSLKIDESALTGESLAVVKDYTKVSNDKTPLGDRFDCAFSSTIITYGSAVGVVYATGMQTEMGKIATLLNTSTKTKELPPLKRKINHLTKVLTICAFSLLALMLVLNGVFYATHYYPN